MKVCGLVGNETLHPSSAGIQTQHFLITYLHFQKAQK
jgi:hypothetical protein